MSEASTFRSPKSNIRRNKATHNTTPISGDADRQKQVVDRYENELLKLVNRVSRIQELMEFSEKEFKDNFKMLPILDRINLFLSFSNLQTSLLDTLRKSVGASRRAKPTAKTPKES